MKAEAIEKRCSFITAEALYVEAEAEAETNSPLLASIRNITMLASTNRKQSDKWNRTVRQMEQNKQSNRRSRTSSYAYQYLRNIILYSLQELFLVGQKKPVTN